MTNNRVLKIAAALFLIGYIISPVDLVSDMVPLAGWLDDVMAAVILVKNLSSLFPSKQVQDPGPVFSEDDIPEAEVVEH